jgi:5S rRNA maturation endonuclease (ribonuclease M5)
LYNKHKDKIINFLASHKNVYLFLDNDATGKKISNDISKELESRGVNVVDKSTIYKNHKDVNEWWIESMRKKKEISKSDNDNVKSAMKRKI